MVDGQEIGSFTEVTGLAVSIDVEEVPEGGQNGFTHRLLGRMKWPNLVFKRGLTNTDYLFDWLLESSGEQFAKTNSIKPRDGSISVRNAAGKDFRTWNFVGAKPIRWTGPKLAASGRELAVEELEVCHCGFKVGT
jgi:phage tail-like protein